MIEGKSMTDMATSGNYPVLAERGANHWYEIDGKRVSPVFLFASDVVDWYRANRPKGWVNGQIVCEGWRR